MTRVAETPRELLAYLEGSARIDGERLVIEDEPGFRTRSAAELAWTAAFSSDESTVQLARWIVWEASQELGAPSASIEALYRARARGEYGNLAVPAINLRAQAFDMARMIYEIAQEIDGAAVIVELAPTEHIYTKQPPGDYATSVLAGALAAGWKGPVFLQGDHYQINHARYAVDPEGATEAVREVCRQALAAGYGNIDIDTSTLVDLSQPSVAGQQRENFVRAAELTALIRSLEPAGVTVSVGGEIGEVGAKNSTAEELRVYLDGFRRELGARGGGLIGLSKVSVQTGTSHGGTPLEGGGLALANVDFDVLVELGQIARENGLAGAVQHGASTLPPHVFHRFREVGAAEVHLATGLQNAMYAHEAFPGDLYAEMTDWCRSTFGDERLEGQTDSQFVYKTRKKAIGPFKRRLWDLSSKNEILATQARSLADIFDQLGVPGSRTLVSRYVEPKALHRSPPALAGSTTPA